MTQFVVGIDIGGTFTDVVLITAAGDVHIAKGLSTPPDFERGILDILGTLLARDELAAFDGLAAAPATIRLSTRDVKSAITIQRGAGGAVALVAVSVTIHPHQTARSAPGCIRPDRQQANRPMRARHSAARSKHL